MSKIDIAKAPLVVGSRYPAPYDEPCKLRENRQLGVAAGLTQFGVNLTRLKPGVWSSQRHWHAKEDEFVYVLEGEVVYRHADKLYPMKPGDSLFFDADAPHGPEELVKLPIRFLSVISYARESP